MSRSVWSWQDLKLSFKNFDTPSIADDHRETASGAPGVGLAVDCARWCHTASPKSFRIDPSVASLPTRRSAEAGRPADCNKSASVDDSVTKDTGELAAVASSILKTLVRAAGLARSDLLRAVRYLATHVSTWTSKCDSVLNRLVGYS